MNVKAKIIHGHSIDLVNACEADANFILSLRTDVNKSKFLSQTSADVDKQKQWLNAYALDTEQAYFIIKTKDGKNIGTVRLYDIQGDSFCWGSWILVHDAPRNASIESAIIIYKYALARGFHRAHFDVRKGNTSVWKFHERFGAVRVAETDEDYLYEIDEASILSSLTRYQKYLPNEITFEDL